MSSRREEHLVMPSEPALRIIMRGLREIMAEPADGQARLDKIVRQIAGVMVAEVCSDLPEAPGWLARAVRHRRPQPGRRSQHPSEARRRPRRALRRAGNEPINEPEASSHPSFSYRPETGEEIYHSLLAVPIVRGGAVLGVLVVQNRTPKEYSDEDVEVLQATAMVVAEHIVSGAVAGAGAAIEHSKSTARGRGRRADFGRHRARPRCSCTSRAIVVTKLMADDPAHEMDRLETAVTELRSSLDEMLEHEQLSGAGEHRDVLEAYRMFAHDKGWERRMREAVQGGLTAEAAVERVQNATRARMLRQNDPYWRERQRDLDDLSDRLLRILAGSGNSAMQPQRTAARYGACRARHGAGRAARLRPHAPARPRHRGRQRPEPRRHRGQGAGHRRHRPGQAASIERVNPGDSCIIDAGAAARCICAPPARSSPPTPTRSASAPAGRSSTRRCATSRR